MGIGEWSTTTHVPGNVSRNVYALLLQWEGQGTHDHVGKWWMVATVPAMGPYRSI